MTTPLRHLAAAAAVLGAASLGALAVTPDDKPAPPAPAVGLGNDPPPAAPLDVGKVKPGKPVELKYAVDPKPLSDAVKKGLKWLADRQNSDGGWSQGGGWRTGGQGRIEGQDVADPSDVGNTCIALLALIRAGNTPTEGQYKAQVKKGIDFVCEQIEKAKADDLYVTDVRNTQLQTKIGPYADTFLATLVMSELKGRAGGQEKRLTAALDKTIQKIAKHQKEDGTFAGNGGWAPVLSQGVANKALALARGRGAKVADEVIARAGRQSQQAAGGVVATAAPAATAPAKPTAGVPPAGPADAPFRGAGTGGAGIAGGFGGGPLPTARLEARGLGGAGGDAGVPLYSQGQAAGNLQDVLNTVKVDVEAAKKVIADPKASKADKEAATKKLAEAEKLEKDAKQARAAVVAQARDGRFVAGFGSNGGEEFLSFLNISEMLVVKADKDWKEWDGKMQESLPKAQDKDGSWSGQHCITGKTFCTSAALLVLMADRTQFPVDVLRAAREETRKNGAKTDEKQPEKK